MLSASVFPHGIQLKMDEELGAFSSAQHKQSRKMGKKRREKKALQLKEVCWETLEAHSSYPKQHRHSGPLSETQTPPHHVLLFKANVFPQAPFYKELLSLSGCSRKKWAVACFLLWLIFLCFLIHYLVVQLLCCPGDKLSYILIWLFINDYIKRWDTLVIFNMHVLQILNSKI